MILPESRSLGWIQKVASDHRVTNPILVEKVIRAFSLLEALARSGCPFIFKGGSSLMLHFGSNRRLSIDLLRGLDGGMAHQGSSARTKSIAAGGRKTQFRRPARFTSTGPSVIT